MSLAGASARRRFLPKAEFECDFCKGEVPRGSARPEGPPAGQLAPGPEPAPGPGAAPGAAAWGRENADFGPILAAS